MGPHHGAVPREPPPRLADVAALVAGRIALHVELKGDPRVPASLVQAVLGLLEGQVPPPGLLSFDWEALRLARRLVTAIQTEALVADWPVIGDGPLALLSGVGASWLGLRYAVMTATRARQVREAGLRLDVWTVNRRRHWSGRHASPWTLSQPTGPTACSRCLHRRLRLRRVTLIEGLHAYSMTQREREWWKTTRCPRPTSRTSRPTLRRPRQESSMSRVHDLDRARLRGERASPHPEGRGYVCWRCFESLQRRAERRAQAERKGQPPPAEMPLRPMPRHYPLR